MKLDNRLISEIVKYKKEMKESGYDLKNMILVLNKEMFKNNRFELLGFSVVYEDIGSMKYKFKELKKKSYRRF